MGRSPCCDGNATVKKGPWTPEEDKKLVKYIEKHGCGSWRNLPKLAGLNRCGKSCRLRWTNYLRPDIKRGRFSEEEARLIVHHHSVLGNKWSAIAAQLPGRTDNEIKNYWNTSLRKKLLNLGIDPVTHRPRTDLTSLPNLIASASNINNNFATNPLFINALHLQKLQLLQTLAQAIANNFSPNINAMNQLGLASVLGGGSLGLQNLNSIPLSSCDTSFQQMIPDHSNLHTCMQSNDSVHEIELENQSTMTTRTNQTPCLVAASPDNCTVKHDESPVKANLDSSTSSSPSSTSFDNCNHLNLDDLDADFGWKEILDKISWSDTL